jgi:hypothetical protein
VSKSGSIAAIFCQVAVVSQESHQKLWPSHRSRHATIVVEIAEVAVEIAEVAVETVVVLAVEAWETVVLVAEAWETVARAVEAWEIVARVRLRVETSHVALVQRAISADLVRPVHHARELHGQRVDHVQRELHGQRVDRVHHARPVHHVRAESSHADRVHRTPRRHLSALRARPRPHQ